MAGLLNPKIVGMPISFKKRTFGYTWTVGLVIGIQFNFWWNQLSGEVWSSLWAKSLRKIRVNLYRRTRLFPNIFDWLTERALNQRPDRLSREWLYGLGTQRNNFVCHRWVFRTDCSPPVLGTNQTILQFKNFVPQTGLVALSTEEGPNKKKSHAPLVPAACRSTVQQSVKFIM